MFGNMCGCGVGGSGVAGSGVSSGRVGAGGAVAGGRAPVAAVTSSTDGEQPAFDRCSVADGVSKKLHVRTIANRIEIRTFRSRLNTIRDQVGGGRSH